MSCYEEVAVTVPSSSFNAEADKSLLAKIISTPPLAVDRKAVKWAWRGIASQLNSSLGTNFSFRSCRDRAGLLLRKYAVRKRRNEATSGTSEVLTDDDDVLEQLMRLEDNAIIRVQTQKAATASKTQELETMGQRLMQAAEKRVAMRIDITEGYKSSKPKRHRLSTLLDKEQEKAAARRNLEAQKVQRHREEL
ncbi:hypothetical protein PF005_g9439 [Phytophthora fragariae]|uniref:Uncharacterized protein n=1 Tax=Phytophthora fragariae TaxID=53985 RepID=A0A6A4DRY9_9STRA|nr:hypothetical protein PF009_g10666 [Phytophthora fragariae]KAE9013013.1 hypothetical protein PF011_g8665 [Phytophthora fragariae]KAE9116594.1 hypothetical protein PF007_g9601 [Phytophthora fragariae]KAE9145351.1 hypothetical protein PF006_g9788 [Phytophthora fragariae]KAE9215425.1 hypothetical protein PF005_g9439 [Phytophthora fragariae]